MLHAADVSRVGYLLGYSDALIRRGTTYRYLGDIIVINTYTARVLASFPAKAPEPVAPLVTNAPSSELPVVDGANYPLIDPFLLVTLVRTVP